MSKMGIGGVFTAVIMTGFGKIITALGIGFLSYKGLDYMQSFFANWITKQLGSFPADSLQLFYIAGGGVVLNWFFGAIAFVATIKTTSHLTASLRK